MDSFNLFQPDPGRFRKRAIPMGPRVMLLLPWEIYPFPEPETEMIVGSSTSFRPGYFVRFSVNMIQRVPGFDFTSVGRTPPFSSQQIFRMSPRT